MSSLRQLSPELSDELPYEPRDGDVFRIFVSFAFSDNRNREVSQFVADLGQHLAQSGVAFDLYFSADETVQGLNWLKRLTEKLNESDVMIALMSPDYFRSDWCSKEWGAFEERLRQVPVIDPQVPILPVMWQQVEAPPMAQLLQVGYFEVPGYRAYGLNVLRDDDEPESYDKVVKALTEQLAGIASTGVRMPKLRKTTSLKAAFPRRFDGSKYEAWRYCLLPGWVSEMQLDVLERKGTPSSFVADLLGGPVPQGGAVRVPRRNNDGRHHYGHHAEHWDPFREQHEEDSVSSVKRKIADIAWVYSIKQNNSRESWLHSREPVDPGNGKVVLIIPIDPWLVQFDEWLEHVQWAIQQDHVADVVLLAPRSLDEQFRDHWPAIEAQLKELVARRSGSRELLFRRPETLTRLETDLKEVLPAVCEGTLGRGDDGQPLLPPGR